jgi:diguanylate cyclase (GGDEF)-like protein
MMSRLANFIDVAYSELDEINKKLEAVNQQLTTLAIIDELTKLYNRREINHRISDLIENNENFSIVMLDLDYFKSVNDEYGHETGDMVLKEFAKILRKYTDNFNSSSIAGRWGGEEFMLLTPHASADKAFCLAEDIRKEFEAKKFDEKFIHTVSCGVTSFISGENIDNVCTRADRALYNSKNSGRNCTTVL